ncbi:MAG: RluA family pseudouridine synthase [Candidatus Zixiibacteriota bacterium]
MGQTDRQDSVKEIELTVPENAAGERLDKYLSALDEVGLTRTRLQKLIDEGKIFVEGRPVPSRYKLRGGETIYITITSQSRPEIAGENIPLDIVYEDEHLAVVDKPPGMVTHPGAGNYTGTLVNALIFHFKKLSSISGEDRPGIVHRLDKNTSGLLVVAKTDDIYLALQKQLQKRTLKRTYTALICGHLDKDKGTIDLPIGRSTRDRKKMTVTQVGSRAAVTEWRRVDNFRTYDLIEASLLTGRTHQIRVHFSHLGHPVFGDPEYGGRETWHRGVFAPERELSKQLLKMFERQALHARRMSFVHPVTGETLALEAPLPKDYKALLDLLDREGR